MPSSLDEAAAAELMPGDWYVAATNFPSWLSAGLTQPRFHYELASRDPLVLACEVSYLDADGVFKSILGTSEWQVDDFRWRGKGRRRIATSRWSAMGKSADGSVVSVRIAKSFVSPSGIEILVREGVDHPELRAMVAGSTEDFGLSPEDFGSLTWLVTTDRPTMAADIKLPPRA